MTEISSTLEPRTPLAAAGFTSFLQSAIARYRRNRQLRHVMELDDHLLRDIGLTRADIAAMMR